MPSHSVDRKCAAVTAHPAIYYSPESVQLNPSEDENSLCNIMRLKKFSEHTEVCFGYISRRL